MNKIQIVCSVSLIPDIYQNLPANLRNKISTKLNIQELCHLRYLGRDYEYVPSTLARAHLGISIGRALAIPPPQDQITFDMQNNRVHLDYLDDGGRVRICAHPRRCCGLISPIEENSLVQDIVQRGVRGKRSVNEMTKLSYFYRNLVDMDYLQPIRKLSANPSSFRDVR